MVPHTSTPPHANIAGQIIDAIEAGDVEYARLEFPAAFIPLREHLEPEDDDMLAMDFVTDENDRVVALISYADYSSEDFVDAPQRLDWTLFDEKGVASFNVLFHDVDDANEWMKEHAVLTIVARDDDVEGVEDVEDEFKCMVSELIMNE